MKKQNDRSRKRRAGIPTAVALAMLFASDALGREWTVDGKKVEAKLIDYDATQVFLEDANEEEANDSPKAVPINELTENDRDYLTKFASICDVKSREDLQLTPMRKDAVELPNASNKKWYISLVGPNGRYIERTVFAVDSHQASDLVLRQFSNARVVRVRKQY